MIQVPSAWTLKIFLTVFCALGMAGIETASAKPTEVSFKDTPLDLNGVNRIVVNGFKGSLRLLSSAGAGAPRWGVLKAHKTLAEKAPVGMNEKFEALSLNIRRDGEALIIETVGPQVKTGIESYWASGAPEMALELELPANAGIAIEASFHDSLIQAQGYRAPIAVHIVDGAVRLSGTEGNLKVSIQKGDVKVENHRGRMSVDTYGAKVSAQNVDGDIELMNFNGDTNLAQVKGELDLKSVSGVIAVHKSSGSLDFSLTRASLTVADFEGAVRGSADDGSVSLQVIGETDVGIQSHQGAVTVKLPPASGATLKLRSDEGAIVAPESISITKNGEERSAQGRLNGSGPKGSVVISSKSGAIRVR